MIFRTWWSVFAALTCLAAWSAQPTWLYRVERGSPGDRDALLATGVPVVLETASCLVAEGDRETAEALRADGWEVTLLDGVPEGSDYFMVSLRPDSDMALLAASGVVVHTEDNWVLLRAPRGGDLTPLSEARTFLAPLPHEPLKISRSAPLHEGPTSRRPAGPSHALPLVQKLVSAVQPSQIDTLWGHLSPPNGSPTPTRYTTLAGCGDDAEYVYNTLVGWGVAAERQTFSAGYAPNVVATLPGAVTPSRIYIAEGHLDDMPSSGYAPGADDNASGTVVSLEAARVMSCYAYKSTVKLLAVTGEETGLEGSIAYSSAAYARGDDIRAVLNMDMVGWQGNGQPAGEDLDLDYNSASQDLALLYAQCAADYATGLAVNAILCPSFTGSDHIPFWQRGYRAVCGITDNEGVCGHLGNYPYYHTSSDTLANCGNRTFFYDVVETTVATLAELAEPFRITFAAESYPCSEPAQLIVGDRDLNTSPTTSQTVQVEVWSSVETTPESFTLTEDGVNSMLFRGSAPLTFGAPVHGDGQVSVSDGAVLHSRYVDALDCDGASGVVYEASASIQGQCGPALDFDSRGSFAEVLGDGDAFLEPGEAWSVPVTLRNIGSASATAAHASLSVAGATVCDSSASFGTLAPGETASASYTFVISPAFSPCGGQLSFSVTAKSCAEATPAGADEPGVFAASVGHSSTPAPVTVTLQPSTADAFVNQYSPTTPAGTGTTMEVLDRSGRARRALVAFDLTSIPAGSAVTSAALNLYASSAPPISKTLEVRRLLGPWSESAVTWNTQPNSGEADASTSGGTQSGWKSWDVRTAVAAWISGASTNHGFVVRASDESAPFGQTYVFATREGTTPAQRPSLSVTYQAPTAWSCPFTGNAQCAPAIPSETAPGDTPSNAQAWTGKTTHLWPANAQATSGYKVVLGTLSQLPSLLDATDDSCVRWTGPGTSCALNDTPGSGSFYWYLVIGANTAGDGSPGSATAGLRIFNTTGACP